MSRAVDRAYERIRSGILKGEFAPASRLKEEELVRLCGVSRTPVREALGRLAAEDYVIVARNQGAQVKTWSDADMADLFDLRALLEGHAAARAAAVIDPEEVRRLRENVDAMEAVLASFASDEEKTDTFLRLNGEFHEAIWKAAGSERLESLLGRLVEQALVVRTAHQYTMDRIVQSQRHHRDLVTALGNGDALWAEAVMRGHIRAALVFVRQHGGRPAPAGGRTSSHDPASPREHSPLDEKCIQSDP